MKKWLKILLPCILAGLFYFPNCLAEQKTPLRIVCTTFPQYDWTRQVLGENAEAAELTLLLDNGVDLHNYQPTAADIAQISACDLFVFVGGTSDIWVTDVLAAANNPDLHAISMMECVEIKEEETVEGMQPEESEEESSELEYDEHVWLSLRNAQRITQAIADALCAQDPENAEAYQANVRAYIAKLAALDAQYQTMVDNAQRKTLLFADRFPFRYLADDYGLRYFAAFAGCSAETEASFQTIAFLAGKVDEMELPAVIVIEGANHSLAETVISCTQSQNQEILAANSIQSVTAKDVANGFTYLDAMEKNLVIFERALN